MPAEKVAMRRDPEPAREATDEMSRGHVEDPSRLRQRERPETALVEEVSEVGSDVVLESLRGQRVPIAQMG